MAMSNKEFGRRVGYDHTMVSRLRSGHRLPSVDKMEAISREFGIPWSDLLEAYRQGAPAFGRLLRERVLEAPCEPSTP